MLASRSDVFRAMFAHDMKENQLGVVQLDDTEPQVVKQFLAFIYTDHFDDTSFATVSKLLPLAEKYNVKRLCSLCGQVWTMERFAEGATTHPINRNLSHRVSCPT